MDERGSYLLQRYSITYLGSGRDLLRMQVPLESKQGPVVIADPFFGEPRMAAAVPRRSVTTGSEPGHSIALSGCRPDYRTAGHQGRPDTSRITADSAHRNARVLSG
jgi:hypothetical protein